jgi:cytochrome c oxidase cbb3-type subunit 3
MAQGEEIWLGRCSACHGAQAQGFAGLVPPLRRSHDIVQREATTVLHIVLKGAPGPGALPMPAFEDRLDDRQAAAVATYLRTSWGNRAPEVSVPEVASLRRRLTGERPRSSPINRAESAPSRADEGAELYRLFHCDGCHGAGGGGGSGPPLIDDRWRYGGEVGQIHASIVEGRPNGMPAFGALIPDRQAWRIAAHVRALSISRVPNGTPRPPQRTDLTPSTNPPPAAAATAATR